ncbi:uncharacterized protein APUU_51558A [Aspergillus puulaauensis]|uniref:Major facilitator superfamily (MFS) profile domain-containing protein n=1 Tax=Aspergillus puulaauensis TaxID=1220207 RepID=A0A7R8AQA1_9EURO|nr:uncharacterized protein APUU_51558A [Aspergillus puulaauensis]BCS26847.1 hypothetical protein APUU_51558A [Aspergillus puulaauensis]
MPLGVIQVDGQHAPGTVLLINQTAGDGFLQEKHDTGKNTNVILVPQPSNSPNDPLNWPQWKKNLAYAVIFANSIIYASIPAPLIAPSTVLLSQSLGRSIKDVSMLTAYQLLLCACYGPIASALAHKYGKRPQFIFGAVMGMVGTIVCCTTTYSYRVLLAGRIIQGVGSSVFESLSMAVIGDLFFVHERSFRASLLVMTWTCIISLVSILGGLITEELGWRYVFLIHLPFTIVGVIATFLLLPETQYQSDPDDIAGAPEETQVEDKGRNEISHEHDELPDRENGGVPSSSTEMKKTFVQELAIYSRTFSDTNLFKLVFAPFGVLLNPAVIWLTIVGSVCIALYVALSYILAQIWSPPPYNLNARQNGTFYVGALIGGLLSSTVSPWVGDIITTKMTKWNQGVYEPEFRIPMIIFATLFCGIGWFVFMWDLDNPTPHGYYLGAFCHGCLCAGTTIGMTVANLYILDAFRESSTEIFVLAMASKNFLFYGFSEFINDWTERQGPSEVLRVFGIVTMCIMATSLVLCKFD